MNDAGDWCYIDPRGEVVIPATFVTATDFAEGMAAVTFHYGGEFGYIDTSGATVLAPRFGWANPFRNGLALVDPGWG